MASISRFANDFFTIKFNSALPVSIEVLSKVSLNRYELSVGRQVMKTKSLAPLNIGARYWGNFSKNKEGMLCISDLKLKPKVLQDELNFFELNSWDTVEQICTNGTSFLKNWILDMLAQTQNKQDFLTLTSMLLALNDGIVHLPFKINNRPFLIQYKTLNKNLLHFYLAYDTMGAIKGEIGSEIRMKVLYKKSANLFVNKKYEDKDININIADELAPLWRGVGGILDEEG